ncbi:hypothetical protein FE257_003111 [Aspergillus nanangensis]|uniref:6-phosphogluconate dehydrogenase NADP-binding domain-containing protein n=1 Tax=Aspergillus nanangensis TaxID=2582783 RepID=A0AAD4CBY1_ASPNN|nr:hypothetical protein FE257_003111 [Aspergillus nanangensis]
MQSQQDIALIANDSEVGTNFIPDKMPGARLVSSLFLNRCGQVSSRSLICGFLQENASIPVLINCPNHVHRSDIYDSIQVLESQDVNIRLFILDHQFRSQQSSRERAFICEVLILEPHHDQVLYSIPNQFDDEASCILQSIFKEPLKLSDRGNSVSFLAKLVETFKIVQFTGVLEAMRLARSMDISSTVMLDIIQHAAAKSGAALEITNTVFHNGRKPSTGILKKWLSDTKDFEEILNILGTPVSLLNSAQSTISRLIDDGGLEGLFLKQQTSVNIESTMKDPVPRDSPQFFQDWHTTIFVCGLGPIGMGISRTFSRSSLKVYAFDILDEKMTEVSSYGVKPVTFTQGLEISDYVCMVVNNADQILQAIQRNKTTIRRKKGQKWFLHSTMASSDAINILETLQNLNPQISVVDAPVSGGPVKAQSGQLLIIVGESKCPSVHWVLSMIAARLIYVHRFGDGCRLKALHQIPAALNLVSSFQFFNVGLSDGFSKKFLYKFLKRTSAWNMYLIDRIDKLIGLDFTRDAQLSIWTKDLAIVQRETSESLPLVDELQSLYNKASDMGLGREADSTIAHVIGRLFERVSRSDMGIGKDLTALL